MLVLSRAENREIVLRTGEHKEVVIRIRVTKIKGKHVRLGIIAPSTVSVFRSEIDPGRDVETEGDKR